MMLDVVYCLTISFLLAPRSFMPHTNLFIDDNLSTVPNFKRYS